MSDGAWLATGFIAAWAMLGAYVVRLWLTQRGLSRQLAAFERTGEPTRPGRPSVGGDAVG